MQAAVNTLTGKITDGATWLVTNWRFFAPAALFFLISFLWYFRNTFRGWARKISPKVWIGLSVLLLLAGWFYWFQYHPSQARASCGEWAYENLSERTPSLEYAKPLYEVWYESCLSKKGIAR